VIPDEEGTVSLEEFIGSFGADKRLRIFAGEVIPGDQPEKHRL